VSRDVERDLKQKALLGAGAYVVQAPGDRNEGALRARIEFRNRASALDGRAKAKVES
jgi:hypothetical protein